MTLGQTIRKLRTDAKLTQARFSEILGVTQQSVQRWESGAASPDLGKLVSIAKHFGVSLDALVLGQDRRAAEEQTRVLKPRYQSMPNWELYSSSLVTEYTQSLEEGLDVVLYGDVFDSVARLPKGEIKERLGDALFLAVSSAPTVEGYAYNEPSDLESIRALRPSVELSGEAAPVSMRDRLLGAWMGRICGCMLGKTVEGIRSHEMIPFLKETGNYPMHRYIRKTDLTPEILARYSYGFATRFYADEVDGVPVDDDTNYTVMAQEIIREYGRGFTPYDVSRAWLKYQTKDAYCTAERVAYCNFVKGFVPPESALYKNPYREWIGAQIRADYFGYINPGDPEKAAEMAHRDASVSHIKNGIYGEMWVAAMLAVAAKTADLRSVILGGLGQIPRTSRLYEAVMWVVDAYGKGVSREDCFAHIHELYDEYTEHGWCHTISNAMIVAASLLYGEGDYGRSVCMAVETCFDTDCNAATVGSVLGMAYGIGVIPSCWTAPANDTLHTSLFGVGTVRISERVDMTLAHIEER